MSKTSTTPLPKTITGGCLCTAVRYRVTFPPNHDFAANQAVCQCTQCRKQSGSVIMPFFRVPLGSVEWLSGDRRAPVDDTPAALKTFSTCKEVQRGFCSRCGSWTFWRIFNSGHISFSVGSVDPLYLFGEGAGKGEGVDVPAEGFGKVICNGSGTAEWSANEIKGVTDDMPLLLKSKRVQQDSWRQPKL